MPLFLYNLLAQLLTFADWLFELFYLFADLLFIFLFITVKLQKSLDLHLIDKIVLIDLISRLILGIILASEVCINKFTCLLTHLWIIWLIFILNDLDLLLKLGLHYFESRLFSHVHNSWGFFLWGKELFDCYFLSYIGVAKLADWRLVQLYHIKQIFLCRRYNLYLVRFQGLSNKLLKLCLELFNLLVYNCL